MTLPFEIPLCAVRRDSKSRQASLSGFPCVQQIHCSLVRQMLCAMPDDLALNGTDASSSIKEKELTLLRPMVTISWSNSLERPACYPNFSREDCLFLSLTVEVRFDVRNPEFHSQTFQGSIPNLFNECYIQQTSKGRKDI